jgi:hypothetical protein
MVPNGGRSVAHATITGRTAMHNGKKVQVDLNQAVKMWPTPQARDWKRGATSESLIARNKSPDNTLPDAVERLAGGALNPTWVEWLMGYPSGWTVCEPSATASSRRSPNSLEGQS